MMSCSKPHWRSDLIQPLPPRRIVDAAGRSWRRESIVEDFQEVAVAVILCELVNVVDTDIDQRVSKLFVDAVRHECFWC